jgi:hypothetical protein
MHMEDDFILMQRYEADLLGWCNSTLAEGYEAKVASFNLSWNTEDHGKVKALSWKDGSALCMLVKACMAQKAMSTEEDVDDTIDILENPVHNLNEAKRKAADVLGIRLRFNALKLIGCKNTHCSLRKTFVRPIVDESSKEEGGLCRSCIPDELTIIQVRQV